MSQIRYVISIDWQTIALVTAGVLICIFAYSRLVFDHSNDENKGP